MTVLKGIYIGSLFITLLSIPFNGFSQSFLLSEYWKSDIQIKEFSDLDTDKIQLVKFEITTQTESESKCVWYFGDQLIIQTHQSASIQTQKFDYEMGKHGLIISSPNSDKKLKFRVGVVSTGSFALLMRK